MGRSNSLLLPLLQLPNQTAIIYVLSYNILFKFFAGFLISDLNIVTLPHRYFDINDKNAIINSSRNIRLSLVHFLALWRGTQPAYISITSVISCDESTSHNFHVYNKCIY